MKTIQLILICAFIGMFVHGYGQQVNYENVPQIIRTNFERDYLPQIKKAFGWHDRHWYFDGFNTYKMSITNYSTIGIDVLWYNTSGEVVRIEQLIKGDSIPSSVIEQYRKDYPESIGCALERYPRKITEGTESVYVLDVDCRASYRVFYSSKGVKNSEVRKE